MQNKVLIVDDHAVVRQGLRTLIEKEEDMIVVGEADSGEKASIIWQETHPDITLLDLDMPGIGGLETLKRILGKDEYAKVLIFSMHDESVYAMRAIQFGAKGFLLKTDPPDHVIEAIRSILKGGKYISHELAQNLAMEKFINKDNPVEILSPREFEVFRRIANGEAIATISKELHIGYKTAANIQTQVRQKLGANTTGQLVHIAMRYGVTKQSIEKLDIQDD